MSLNLHAIVRAAITVVNADIAAAYLASTGYTPNAAGKQVPGYAAPVTVQIQVQPPSEEDLQHLDFLNIQGPARSVYLYSDPSAIVRVDAKGGDLLQFPQFAGAPVDNWLVVAVPELWNVGQNGLTTFSGVATLEGGSNQMTVTAVNGGALNVGDTIMDTGALPADTSIKAFGSGSGGVGTYILTHEATASETGATIVVTDSVGLSGWSKLIVRLQTDRPAQS